jgi:uncharacterized protein (TIGR02466 family)
MELYSLFITPVFSVQLKEHEHLSDAIYQLKEKDQKGMPRSNIGGWHSNDELHKIKKFKPLVNDILKHAKDCFNHMDVKDNFVPNVTGMWAIINPPGSRNNTHTHPYNYLSGVFYLKAPKKSGSIVFLEPKPQAEVLSPPKTDKASVHLAHSVERAPIENSLIFFPSWLQHEVQTNNSNDDRVAISFNINWRKNDADS